MSDKIKIDYVSDIVCPWCIIGFLRLEKAIKEMGLEDKVEIEWQPFQLNPNMPKEGQKLNEHLSEKYGSSDEDILLNQERLTEMGADEGFDFHFFKEMKIFNTKEAHVLLDFAKQKGKQSELNKRLVTAYFSENKNISETSILLNELEAIGLNSKEAEKILQDEVSELAITEKENYWKSLGVRSVPTIVFNRKTALSGAQPKSTFKEVLTQLSN